MQWIQGECHTNGVSCITNNIAKGTHYQVIALQYPDYATTGDGINDGTFYKATNIVPQQNEAKTPPFSIVILHISIFMVFLCVQSLSFTNSSEDHQQTPLVQPYPYRAFQCLKRYFICRCNIFFKLTIIFPRVPGQESKFNDKPGGHPMID